ncbi:MULTISPECIES: antibiotic biosynthesis monooxygenase family protein [Priestia]|jgi:heme-degrading monooxygenase HmoA|uniref:Antibiotic biosynthesis monooxygenase n=1 Tax=Priestia megaterium TaxID=1404 RepID=A0AAE5PAN3_PRIMG|nr:MULTISPECIES: antibiotic biosynthesis monooxygenase [Priestia]AVX06704.1 antibiotic biosynthesis monooxygenase [Bacillus sp. Y-01]MBZ5482275.1 antibiotic biosynthesis monooxygenase [Bacillus sp. T_4]MDH6656531.1 heme-degrading monooxygenase HmoA [Bacillus sp. PvP124]RFB21504.1 antibiotic biosynthesis monooxygenase [Bacillus sp. ALD]RFB33871.1 antibiotic biosynthesis monooxygenase [Bacillus sp. RC]
MFVVNASFETEKKFEEQLKQKANKNKAEIEAAKGNLSFECWKKYSADKVEYVLVSKWEDKQFFQAWISREEHVNEHKEANKKKMKACSEAMEIKKMLRFYEAVEEDILS